MLVEAQCGHESEDVNVVTCESTDRATSTTRVTTAGAAQFMISSACSEMNSQETFTYLGISGLADSQL